MKSFAAQSRFALLVVAALLVAACGSSTTAEPSVTTIGGATDTTQTAEGTANTTETNTTEAETSTQTFDLLAFGDAADCREPATEVAELVRDTPGDIVIAGDLAYPEGSQANFNECYGPLYGDMAERIRAVPGDNDYKTEGALPFFTTLGAEAAGQPGQGWWSYTKENWQVIGINSKCSEIGFCGPASPQYEFVANALEAEPGKCRIAVWHQPRFTSSANYDGLANMGDLYTLLYEAGTDILVVGNSHHYERFEPLDPTGTPSPDGIANFTIGTGGAPYTEFGAPLPGSAVRNNDTRGVTKFSLGPDSYSWEFLAAGGGTLSDSGTLPCHNANN